MRVAPPLGPEPYMPRALHPKPLNPKTLPEEPPQDLPVDRAQGHAPARASMKHARTVVAHARTWGEGVKGGGTGTPPCHKPRAVPL